MAERPASGSRAHPPSRSRLRRRLGYGVTIGVAATLLLAGLRTTGSFSVLEWKTYDARARLFVDPASATDDIVFIEIGENTMEVMRDVLGRWPWSRDAHAVLLDYLRAAGARLVVFDVMFYEPVLAGDTLLFEGDTLFSEGDRLFADRLAAYGRTVLPVTFTPGSRDEAEAWEAARAAEGVDVEARRALLLEHRIPQVGEGGARGESPERAGAGDGAGAGNGARGVDLPGAEFAYPETPYRPFLRQALAVGSINLNADPDGVVRRDRLLYGYRGGLYPSLALAAARVLEPGRFGGEAELEGRTLRIGEERIPVGDDGKLLLRWRGPYREAGETTWPVYPAFHVFNSYQQVRAGQSPDVPLEAFRDRVVFIGVTAVGTGEFDVRPTPLKASDPGVVIHATALDNLLRGDYLRRAPSWANLALLAVVGIGAGVLTAGLGSGTAATVAIVLLLGGLAGGALAAFAAGVWIDVAAPGVAGALAFAGSMVANYVSEGREKRRVREMFSRYVSPEYVSRLADDFESLELGGERTPITLLFSDIRGFTSLSERLPASDVIEMLNAYLDRMAEVVFRHGGTLDKFIGDAVMAFWGAPIAVEDHARRALDAALEMQDELDALNARWMEEGAPAQMAIGIGINTGEAVVGNIGSLTRKLDYTAIGDAVNLAARLESLNKSYETEILVSEHTVSAVGDGYDFRLVESVTVKGKTQAVNVYELRGRTTASESARDAGPAKEAGSARDAGSTVLPALLLATSLLLGGAGGLDAQDPGKARWLDWIYEPGAWVSGEMRAYRTSDPATDSLAFRALVDVFSMPPDWRAEIRKVEDGRAMGEPVVVVSDGGQRVVLTAVGATPLAEHAAARDPVVMHVLEGFDASGRPRRPAPARIVDQDASGQVRWVVVRRAAARADFDESLLDAGSGGLGARATRFGIHAMGGERRQEVVASAGARGVTTVRTADGEIQVVPDTAAVRRMERVEVGVLEMERFLREVGAGQPVGRPDAGDGAAPAPADSDDAVPQAERVREEDR